MDSDWSFPHGDRLMSRRSVQRTHSNGIIGSKESFRHSPQTTGRLSTAPLDRDGTMLLKTDPKNMMADKDFLHSTPIDSSEDEATAPSKLFSTFPDRLNENQSGSPNESSENGELEVSEEIKSLFQFIGCYKPREVEIGAVLRPFIPDYIPAVGAVDEFIKVPRPDGLVDYLGLKVLDESGSKQSDPSLITLQMMAATMQSSHHPVEVATIEDPEKNARKIDAWIESMKDLHRAKPPPSVTYSKPMPDMQKLTKEWPLEVDKRLMELPNPELDMDLETFVDICCAFLNIPV